MSNDLTFDEKYNVPIEIVLDEFAVEYADCGSHQLRLRGKTNLGELQAVYKYLTTLKGITPQQEQP